MQTDEPRGRGGAPAILERPIVRAVIGAVVVGVLALVAVIAARAGDDGGEGASGPVSVAGAPTPETTPPPDDAPGALEGGPPIVGQPAPDFALRDTDGNLVRLSELRGKVVWVNFWAYWCTPCKKELPAIQKLYDEKRAAGLEVLAVNWQDSPERARAFFAERGFSMPVLLDRRGDVYDEYRLRGLPDSFFIDREGNISGFWYGALDEERMRQRLEEAGLP